MTEPLLPEQIEALMAGYVLNDLTSEETEVFERLLAENPRLTIEVKRLQETLDVLPYALPEVEPPPHLKEAILAATTTQSIPQPQRWRWGSIAAVIAALVALVAIWDGYRLRQQLSSTRQNLAILKTELETIKKLQPAIDVLQQPNTRVFSLAGTDKASTASGNIAIDSQQKKAVIVFQNLPTPAANQIYRLWAIADDKKVACASFKTTPQGKVLEEFPLSAIACSSGNSTLAVSLEPIPSPPQPTGPIVMLERS
jgi:anti-sigma-K factor RskA